MSKGRKKDLRKFLKTAISDSAQLAKDYDSRGVSDRLRIEQLRQLNAAYRGYDFDLSERTFERLSRTDMSSLYSEYIAKGGVIQTVKARRKYERKSSCGIISRKTVKATYDSAGEFVWTEGK